MEQHSPKCQDRKPGDLWLWSEFGSSKSKFRDSSGIIVIVLKNLSKTEASSGLDVRFDSEVQVIDGNFGSVIVSFIPDFVEEWTFLSGI